MGKTRWMSWALICVVTCTGCKWFSRDNPSAERGAGLSGVAAPKVEGPRIVSALVEVPTAPPFIGEEGVDTDGFPMKQPDKVALINLLRLEHYDLLDRFFGFYQDEFEKDFHFQDWPEIAVSSYYVADPTIEARFDAWIEHNPKSFAAYVSRGNYRHRLGMYYRGGKFANATSIFQFATMDEYFAAARRDLRKALELRPRLIAAYTRLIMIASAGSAAPGEEQALLEAALESCPLCLTPRRALIGSLEPRWGGSYRAMDSFAKSTKKLWKQNPRLRVLTGASASDRCDDARRHATAEIAEPECERALKAGEDSVALEGYAELRYKQERYPEAIGFVDRALRLDPHNRAAVELRMDARVQTKDYLGAAADAFTARQLDPTEEHVADAVKWLVNKLRSIGKDQAKAGDHVEAIKTFAVALRLAPDDRDLIDSTTQSQMHDTSDESLNAQLAAAPDDYSLRLRIDAVYAGARRYPEVVKMWDAFIANHPKDPRPYFERGGAKSHLGNQFRSALEDTEKACDLGLEEACGIAKRLKERLEN